MGHPEDWEPTEGQEAKADAATAQETAEEAASAAAQAQQSADAVGGDLTAFINAVDSTVEDLQSQIDGSITTWFLPVAPTASNAPASGWTTTDDKNNHLGDLYYDTVSGYCYRWQVQDNAYSWQRITDTDVTKALADAAAAQDAADSKRRVFTATPSPPYDVGDLWAQGTTGDLMRCKTAKASGQSYLAADWEKASKYTDDAAAIAAQSAAAAPTYKLVSNCSSISQDPSGACTPGSLSVRSWQTVASSAGTTSDSYYAGRLKVEGSADGSTWTAAYTASSNSSLATVALSTVMSAVEGCAYVRVTLYKAGGTTTQLAQAMLSVVQATGNYILSDSTGFYACETEGDPNTGGALRLASDRVELLTDGSAGFRLMENLIELGIDSVDALIKLCAGALTISVDDQGRASLLAPEKIIQVGGANGAYVYAGEASNYGSLGIDTSGTVQDYGAGTLTELGSTSSRGGGISIARLGLFSPSTAGQKSKAVFEVEQMVVGGSAAELIKQVQKVSFGSYSGTAGNTYTKTEGISGFSKPPIAIPAGSGWCLIRSVSSISTTSMTFSVDCVVNTSLMSASFYLIEFI